MATCSYDSIEADNTKGSIAAFWPWGGSSSLGALGIFDVAAIPIGTLVSTLAKALVLTVLANTPAAASQPFSSGFTAANGILAPNVPAELLFGSTLRIVPIKLQLLPYTVAGLTKHFAWS